MNCYHIGETLFEVPLEKLTDAPYAAVLTPEEWETFRDSFEFGIDLDLDLTDPRVTKVEVNYDSLTGSFSIPDRTDICGKRSGFSFVLDEKGIVFIDCDKAAQRLVERVRTTKKWRTPSLERFLYDFLEAIIREDLPLLERFDSTLAGIENRLMDGSCEGVTAQISDIRGDLLDLRTHYEQLIDVSQELEENENGFFVPESLRYFRMFTERVTRLQGNVTALRDYATQVHELYQTQLDVKQNRTMTVLTVVTTIFLPLTLIVGWYGMNFANMPELSWRWGYPMVILVSVVIVLVCFLYFRRKKLL